MRYTFFTVLLLIGMASATGAQELYIPVLDAASTEYGISGSYNKQAVSDTADVSDFAINVRYGKMLGFGIELEAEGGYTRHKADVPDSLGTTWNIGGNALYNLSILSPRLSFFGLIGYGYEKYKNTVPVNGVDVETSSNTEYLQYGVGAKYMLVANTAVRVDYRWVKPSDDLVGDRQVLMIGVSIFQ